MAKKSSKATTTPLLPAASEAPTPSQDTGSTNIDRTVEDVLSEIAKVQTKRAELAGLLVGVEKQEAKLREVKASYEAEVAAVDQLQADLIARYPAAKGVFAGTSATKRGGGKRASTSTTSKKAGPALDKAQAEQVLVALPSTFQLGEFKAKAAELFPDRIGKGAMKLLAEKVKDAGGKGMGRKYRKV